MVNLLPQNGKVPMQTKDLLRDPTRRQGVIKANKKQTRKSAALQKNARKEGIELAIDATTLDPGSSSASK